MDNQNKKNKKIIIYENLIFKNYDIKGKKEGID